MIKLDPMHIFYGWVKFKCKSGSILLDNQQWVIITLDNDKHIYGKFGCSSLASSEKDERDIYQEEIYNMDEDGKWVKRERTDGIWIKASNIKVIEFINRQGESLMDKKYGQFGYQPVRIEKKGYQPTTSGASHPSTPPSGGTAVQDK